MTPISRRAASIGAAHFDALNARASQLRQCGESVISLGQAVPGFGPPPVAVEAMTRSLEEPWTHIYSSDAGLEMLRAALCARLAETMAVCASPADLIITTGGNQAFMLALLTVVDAGDEVVLPAPYFANHEMAVRAGGAIPVEAPLNERDGFNPTWDRIEPHLTSRTRAVVVCNPSNPTGAVADRASLDRIAAELRRRGVMLITDETYMHFVYSAAGHCSAASLPEWRANVVVIGTFSKSFGITGWRVGYMLADAAVCEQAVKIQDAMVICAAVPSQVGVAAAVREAWDYPLSFRSEFASRRAVLQEELPRVSRLDWAPTEGGFFAFVRVNGCVDSVRLSWEILETAHVVTIPGAVFGRCGEGYLRLSYGATPEGALREGMHRLERFFSTWTGAA
jgi:aspartate/methionine/tyrosine aminotransferase